MVFNSQIPGPFGSFLLSWSETDTVVVRYWGQNYLRFCCFYCFGYVNSIMPVCIALPALWYVKYILYGVVFLHMSINLYLFFMQFRICMPIVCVLFGFLPSLPRNVFNHIEIFSQSSFFLSCFIKLWSLL